MRPAPVHEHIYSDGKICVCRRAPLRSKNLRYVPATCHRLVDSTALPAPCFPMPPARDAQASTSCTTTGTRSSTSSRSASRCSRCSRARRARSARRTTTPRSSCRRGRRRGICNGSSMMTSAKTLGVSSEYSRYARRRQARRHPHGMTSRTLRTTQRTWSVQSLYSPHTALPDRQRKAYGSAWIRRTALWSCFSCGGPALRFLTRLHLLP